MDSIKRLQAALSKSPQDPELYYNLGGEYLAKHMTAEAITAYQDALRLAPNHPQILLQLGNAYMADSQLTQAVLFFKRCIHADARNASAYFNLGNALRAIGQAEQAVSQYERAIALNPRDAEAHNNLGNALRDLGRLDASIACYQQALAIQPKLYHALAHLIHQKQHVCQWDNLDNEINLLRTIVKANPNEKIAPFAFLAMPGTTADEQLQCANHWAAQRFGGLINLREHLNFTFANTPSATLRLGYLSADFRLHPLAFLITDVLKGHDRSQFEVFAYAYGLADDSEARNDIMDAVDHFVDINGMSDIEAAKRIHHDQIDVLIDLTGYTKHSRTAIVALKPARHSINWLGYPGSMGNLGDASLFDYVIVDDVVAPDRSVFSESLLSLPCYQPNNQTRPIGVAGAKTDHQLPAEAFVFCCFNQTFKFTDTVFQAWMRILTQVPHSVLWLLDCNPWAKRNLLNAATSHGVAPERLIFAPRVSIADHLARHVHADLFLDTLPYNAHTTASDALWMGVPIVTCMGGSFPGRVCASLLNTVGLLRLVTNDLEDYISLAVTLAANPAQLAQANADLTAHRAQLFDSPAFVSRLETAYQRICSGHAENP
jgi:protein O-GlcNAc transferase